MNRYQNALDKLETWSADLMEVLPTVYKEWQNKNKKVEYYKELKEAVDTLQELVEKATPKKPIDMSKESYDTIGVCPNCRTWCYMEHHSEYCGECGQALDWGEE